MGLTANIRLAIFLISFTIVTIIYYMRSDLTTMGIYQVLNVGHLENFVANEIRYNGTQKPGYLVWSPSCRILDVNPWDESIRKYMRPTSQVVCSPVEPLTFVERRRGVGNVLRIDENVLSHYTKNYKTQLQCCYFVVTRITQTDDHYNSSADNNFSLSECKILDKEAVLANSTEFVLVKCKENIQVKKRESLFENIHAVVPVLPSVQEKLQTPPNNQSYNVLMLGIDSVSRLNFQRKLPSTASLLKHNKWIEFNGYNKIGDNTFPNLMAILSGLQVSQLPANCYQNRSRYMDDCPLIWNNFSREGYVTAYAEDVPSIGTFNYMRTGFLRKPTDYYMRSFLLAAEKHLKIKKKDGLDVCLGPVSVADHILNYAKDFAETFVKNRFFGLFWLNSFSHNNVNSVGALDIKLVKFLRDISENEVLDNTIVFLFSDHGIRFGNIRESFVGYLEERLPFLYVWLPNSFRETFPEKYENLLTNSRRLTVPYDIHLTLLDILKLGGYQTQPVRSGGCEKCSSLLVEQDYNRSCKDASIDEHWCTCSEFQQVPLDDPSVMKIGKFLYQNIMNRTFELVRKEKLKKNVCLKWRFSKIVRAYKTRPAEDIQQATESNNRVASEVFVVVIELEPKSALFEGTLRITYNQDGGEDDIRQLGFISRLDGYFSTSKCVKIPLLKLYCNCLK